jgi:Alpha/beta hydrolase domain
MAGIRDLMSYLRNNPLAEALPPQASIIFGISQSGRLIQTMLLRGLHVDEDGRPVFDGAFIHVAGGGKGGFDYRFAMPTRHFSMM